MVGSTSYGFWRSVEFVAALGLVVVSVGIFLISRTYPSIDWSMGGPPGLYPQLLAVVLLVLAVLLAIEGLRAPTVMQAPDRWSLFHILSCLGVLVLATEFMRELGFRLVAIVVTFVLMLVLSDSGALRKPSRIAFLLGGAITISLALGYGFEDLAGRRLPAGTWLN